ncbi:MAG TPA: hypothetical protein VH560_07265 [Polyangia bacterium]|jgi:hypothetical protein|nr:hypothetical protein [Polyangia bacterium]
MNNAPPSDNVVLRQTIEQIQRCLPAPWTTAVSVRTDDLATAHLTIRTPTGMSAAVAIGAHRQLDPRSVPEAAAILRATTADAFVVIAPFVGAPARERLAEEGLGYVDLVGNMRLALERPTVLIQTRGLDRSPWAAPRSTRSLHAAKASRIVRALVDGVPPFGVRALAAVAGTDPGYVSRLLDLFDREELVEREAQGRVVSVHRARLVRRWAEDYRFSEAHRTLAFTHPHGVPGALAALRACGAPHALTARAGASALLGTALPSVITAYVENAARVGDLLGATSAAGPGNLLLVEPFDPFPLEGTWTRAGFTYAAASQIVADLLDSPAPAPDQAAALLRRVVQTPAGGPDDSVSAVV